MRTLPVLVLGLAALVGCGSDPVDANGDYTVALTNRDNGCDLSNWTDGATSSGIPVAIDQNGDAATATVGGAAGAVLGIWLGDNHYTGNVDGNDLLLEDEGQNNVQMGNCDYHYTSIIDGKLTGDVLTGEIRYEAVTDGASDCAGISGCSSVQEFNGTRPPT